MLQNCIGQMGLEKLKNFSLRVNERPWNLGHNSPVLRLHSKWIPINPSLSHRWQYFSPVTALPDLCRRPGSCTFNEFEFCQSRPCGGLRRAPIKPSLRNTSIIPKSLTWKPFMILLIKYRMLGFRYDGARYASLYRNHISFQNIMSWIRYQELLGI